MKSLSKIFFALTSRERWFFLAAAAAAAVSAFVLFGVFIQKATVVVPAAGGEYTEGVVGQPIYVNPILASSTDKLLIPLLFANVPDLADKIEMDKDGKAWRVHLKEGLAWSDGQKLTSDDIVFTVNEIQNPAAKSPLAPSWQGVTPERVSELEVRFRLAAPYAFFADHLQHLYVLPRHLFADTPPANWHLSEYNLKPIGSGPYAFDVAEIRPDGFISTYSLKVNPRYAGPAPQIARLGLRFFPNPTEMVKAFNAGAIDGFASLNPELLDEINRSYQLVTYPLPSYYATFFNQSQNPVLSDQTIRRALTNSIDRQALITKIFHGQATPAYGPLPARASQWQAGLPTLSAAPTSTPSLAEITNRLDLAGWKMGDNNVRSKTIRKTVVPLRFTLTVPQVPFLVATANELRATWTQLGVEVDLNILDPNDALTTIQNRDYQALLYGNILNPSLDLYAFWHSSQRFQPGLNLAIYSDRKTDQVLEAIRRELDPQKTRGELAQASDLIIGNYPAIFLYSPDYLFVASKGLFGATSTPLAEPADRLRQVTHWYVRTTRSLK